MNDNLKISPRVIESKTDPFTINLDDRLDPYFENSLKEKPKGGIKNLFNVSNTARKIKNKVARVKFVW